jgi:inner membrane protein involved in colicin E2 resistance
MFRRTIAMAMLVSFIAMSTSGIMMFVIEKPSFTLQMHPVHKLFGLLMIFATIAHIALNLKSIKAHLRFRSAPLAASILTVLLVLMYGVAMTNSVPPELAEQMDQAAAEAEKHQRKK